MKKKWIALLLTAVMIIMTGCTSTQTSEETAQENTQTQTTAQLEDFDIVLDWYPNAVHSFIYVAIEKGYYQEEGLNVNIRFPANTNDALSLTAAGRADMGIYYLHDVIMAVANENVPIKSVGALTQSSLNIVLSLKDKNITSPSDLVGKKVGYSGTTLSEAMLRSNLEYVEGESTQANMELIDVGFDLMSSMTTGQVDATIGCMRNHEVPQMESEGFEVQYYSPSEYGVPEYYELVLVASNDSLENNTEKIKKFLRASQKGFEFMKQNPDEALQILLNNQNEENFPLKEEVEKQSMDILLPLMETDTVPFLSQDAQIWQNSIDWMVKEGIISQENIVKPEDVFMNMDLTE